MPKWTFRRDLQDVRLRKIALAFLVAWGLTIFVGWLLIDASAATHRVDYERDVFFAWLGELLFFTVVGLAISIVSLEKPENPYAKSLNDRIKILFGTTDIPDTVLHYYAQQMVKMASCASTATREIEIREYRSDLLAYEVEVCTDYQIKNLLQDRESLNESMIFLKPDEFGQGEQRLGTVTSI
ncbi:MAG TPA: hypothetical protein VKS22_03465 [Candidatus Binataceae bacterium]|nr:hypothetical protein [Candidatus Binataceae bacterium]